MGEDFLIKKTINAFKCLKCKHEWIPRVSMEELEGKLKELAVICPKCKSPYWKTERKNKKSTGQTDKDDRKE